MILQGPGSLHPVLHGSYSVSVVSSIGGLIPASLGQSGTVPATAQSLRFYMYGFLQVSFNGQDIPLVVLETRPTYTIYGGDISGFANQYGELLFYGLGTLDRIVFSNLPVPEPSALGLLGLGAALLAWHTKRRRHT